MLEPNGEALSVECIHAQAQERPLRIYVIATGAGAGIQKWLWNVPGCSSFFVGASFPYAKAETDALLTFEPDAGYAADETAVDLASVAYQHALVEPGVEPIGLGLTASVATVRAHRGEHRIHLAVMTRDVTLRHTVVLPKSEGLDARMHDGAEADRWALLALRAAVEYRPGVQPQSVEPFTVADDMARQRFFLRPAFDRGRRRTLEEVRHYGSRPLFPGAFNPVHAGHEEIADLVAKFTEEGEPVFEICAAMPHKTPTTVQDMLERAKGMAHRSVLFTDGDPMYIDKARRFPGRGLIIGADAFERFFDPRWGLDAETVLGEMAKLHTTLFVFNRKIAGQIMTAATVLEKAGYLDSEAVAAVVQPMTGTTAEASSTAIREGRAPKGSKTAARAEGGGAC